MKSGCNHHQIGMDYLCDAIFKMAAIKISVITFSPISPSDVCKNCSVVDKSMKIGTNVLWQVLINFR